MTVDHLATSALRYDLYITLFIVFVISFGLASVYAARKVADALKRTDAHDLRRAALITQQPSSNTRPAPITEGRY